MLNSQARGIFRCPVTTTAAGLPTDLVGTLNYSILVDGTPAADNIHAHPAGSTLQADRHQNFSASDAVHCA